MRTHRVSINSLDGIVLEGLLDLPDAESAPPSAGVVICHPHPQYGGEMTNNVVMAISAGITSHGIAALRFNFRGVGRSGGTHDEGLSEQDDALAAMSALAGGTLSDDVPAGISIALAGYSFGGGVALAAAGRAENLGALALISPALPDDPASDTVSALAVPKLIATGEADTFASVERVRRLAGSLAGATEIYIAPETDHFWWGAEDALGRRVGEFVASALTGR